MLVASEDNLVIRLSQLLSEPLKSIEILPGNLSDWVVDDDPNAPHSEFPFLHTEGNLGIPQNVLYQLYIASLNIFRKTRSNNVNLALHSSAVILLANPAFQTALNFRSKLLKQRNIIPEQELNLMRSILSCSKESVRSSLLWTYRRQLFAVLYPTQPSTLKTDTSATPFTLPGQALIEEFDLIRYACESYPRNYHAWSHWQIIINSACLSLQIPALVGDVAPVLQTEYHAVRRWIDHHVSDFSAMFYFCHFHRQLLGTNQGVLLQLPKSDASPATHAMSLITMYPTHESLWLYLRESISLPHSPPGNKEIKEWLASSGLGNHQHGERFMIWSQKMAIAICDL